jgi:hypothetical protein
MLLASARAAGTDGEEPGRHGEIAWTAAPEKGVRQCRDRMPADRSEADARHGPGGEGQRPEAGDDRRSEGRQRAELEAGIGRGWSFRNDTERHGTNTEWPGIPRNAHGCPRNACGRPRGAASAARSERGWGPRALIKMIATRLGLMVLTMLLWMLCRGPQPDRRAGQDDFEMTPYCM